MRIVVPGPPGSAFDTIARLMAPGLFERLAADGSEAVGSSPEEFVAFIEAETVKCAAVVKAAGILPE